MQSSIHLRIQALLERSSLKDDQQEVNRNVMDEVINKVDQTPWLQRTG